MNTEAQSTTAFGNLAEEFRRKWGLESAEPVARLAVDVQQLVRAQRLDHFRSLCPPRFLEKIDRTKIPNLAGWDDADTWTGGCPGVWLWSHETGEAKTRFLWRKFGEFHVEQGKTVARVTGLNLAEEYHDCFVRARTDLFYARFDRVDVVMLDDLDKMDLPAEGTSFAEQDRGARNARMLRELFDKFYEQLTPVLVTANEPIAWFAARIGPSGERRMRAVCREVAL